MRQYLEMSDIVITNKNGELRKVRDFRKRIKYDKKYQLIEYVQDAEILRADSLSLRLYYDPLAIGMIIDVNDSDILSFATGDPVYFVSPSVAGV